MYDWVHPNFAANWRDEIPDRPLIAFCNLFTLFVIMICAFRPDPTHRLTALLHPSNSLLPKAPSAKKLQEYVYLHLDYLSYK
uniref:Uncharacterized protein n=1 Tax=Romanomermis culicivorax TaxID=13658 RepID=A0A915I0N3_ROMCU